MKEYFCCDLHHSSYCPECRGVKCKSRIDYKLNPEGGNEEKLKKIRETMMRGKKK